MDHLVGRPVPKRDHTSTRAVVFQNWPVESVGAAASTTSATAAKSDAEPLLPLVGTRSAERGELSKMPSEFCSAPWIWAPRPLYRLTDRGETEGQTKTENERDRERQRETARKKEGKQEKMDSMSVVLCAGRSVFFPSAGR